MTTYYITGSTLNNNKSTIMGVTSTRVDINGIKPSYSNLKSDGAKSAVGDTVTTILQSSSAAVVGLSNVDGYIAVQLGSAPTKGTTLDVTGADYPFDGTYLVNTVSGNYALTTTPYLSCTGVSNYGNYTVNTGGFDLEDQGQFLMMTYTTELAGVSNDALRCNKSNASVAIDKFVQYRSHAYSNSWLCIGTSGAVSPCDVTTTTVTFAEDQAADGVPTVLFSIGLKVQAADLENPDVTGLRDPA